MRIHIASLSPNSRGVLQIHLHRGQTGTGSKIAAVRELNAWAYCYEVQAFVSLRRSVPPLLGGREEIKGEFNPVNFEIPTVRCVATRKANLFDGIREKKNTENPSIERSQLLFIF